MDLKPAEMVAMYIKLRDSKKQKDDEHKKSMERVVAGMEKLEGLLLAHLQESGATSVGCEAGTVYMRIETSATIEDKEAFTDWVKDQPDWSALDIKANKTAIKAMIEAKLPLPPGLKVSQIKQVGVQRS
jgi:hypothetical protein